jgi:hypothetical protein
MATRIVLTVLDEKNRPYMGVFDSNETFYPRTYENGALKEDEHDFLISLAGTATKTWLPADSHRDPLGCVPFWIMEASWAQLDSGPGCYYKFTFNPPLEIQYAAEIPGYGLAPIKPADR